LFVGYHPDIVVVSEKTSSSNEGSSELNKIQYIPLFYPILKSSIDLKDDQDLFNISPESVILNRIKFQFKVLLI
jgi:hypothetical protein